MRTNFHSVCETSTLSGGGEICLQRSARPRNFVACLRRFLLPSIGPCTALAAEVDKELLHWVGSGEMERRRPADSFLMSLSCMRANLEQ